MTVDLVHDAQYFCDLPFQRLLRAVQDVSVWMGRIVAILHQSNVSSDLAIVALDEAKQSKNGLLPHETEIERRGCREQGRFVPRQADQTILKITAPRLPNLPNFEVHETHSEHVV